MKPSILEKLQQLSDRLEEVTHLLGQPEATSDMDNYRKLTREHAELTPVVEVFQNYQLAQSDLADAEEMLSDPEMKDFAAEEIEAAKAKIDELDTELQKLLLPKDADDDKNIFIEVRAGTGGDEAALFAGDLLRMYSRYAERKGFKIEILEEDDGEIAGINRATIRVEGEYAYGLLRTETGVHRLVRYSPFDSNNKRHTSFSSVFVYPEIDDSIEIEINPADLRIDTYRASGAGGQHINKTDSAVRITHEPTGIVVQCQNDRSQHANKAAAMEMLKSKLYELEMRKRNEEKQALEEGKSDVGWGSQIRSYVLDSSRIKDLRTGYEVGNTKAVLDGDLDGFIEASLKQGV